MKKLILLIGALLFLASGLVAQSQSQLERDKKRLQREIREATNVLNQTKKVKKKSLGQLYAVDAQIKNRKALIAELDREVELLEKEEGELKEVLLAMESDLNRMKKEYADLLYVAQKAQNTFDVWVYILAANSIDQMFMRYRYYQQYTKARKVQIDQIDEVKKSLSLQQLAVVEKRNEKTIIVKELQKERNDLASLRAERADVVSELNQRENSIRRQIKKNNKRVRDLDNRIQELIAEAQRSKKGKVINLSDSEYANLSSNFVSNKGRLPWPISKGVITRRFGKVYDANAKLYIESLGYTFQATKGTSVKAIMAGKVGAVERMGAGYLILVQHGDYYVVYNNVKDVKIKAGDNITAGQVIAKVRTEEGVSTVELQIWKGSTQLNPKYWLKRK